MAERNKVLLISYDVIGPNMAGPGVRYFELARVLREYCLLTLAIPNAPQIEGDGFRIAQYSTEQESSLKELVEESQVVVIQGHIVHFFPFLKYLRKPVVVDLYNPFLLESLEMYGDGSCGERMRISQGNLAILKDQLALGDFFICASEKQRDLWIGMLAAEGRINPLTRDQDKTFRRLIDVVTFGLPQEKPRYIRRVLKGVLSGIGEKDKVILWGGGIWNWLDPITPIKAVSELASIRKDVRLVFLGTKHPDPRLPEMERCSQAIQLSRELGLLDRQVFFLEWVSYQDRQNYLLESDIGISCHPEHLETRFSFRTRILDYIWAGLPVIATEGDAMEEVIRGNEIGKTVRPGDPLELAETINLLLEDNSLRARCRENEERLAEKYRWEVVAQPLVQFCQQPTLAADRKVIMDFLKEAEGEREERILPYLKGCGKVLLVGEEFEGMAASLAREGAQVQCLDIEDILWDGPARRAPAPEGGIAPTPEGGIVPAPEGDVYDAVCVSARKSSGAGELHDLVGRAKRRLKEEGVLCLLLPGVSESLVGTEPAGKQEKVQPGRRWDRETFLGELVLRDQDFEILAREEIVAEGPLERTMATGSGKGKLDNVLDRISIIPLDTSSFEKIRLLSRFDILRIRKSYNETMKAINNNLHLQLNHELNQINQQLRDRLLFLNYHLYENMHRELAAIRRSLASLSQELGCQKESEGESQGFRDREAMERRVASAIGSAELVDRFLSNLSPALLLVARKVTTPLTKVGGFSGNACGIPLR
ncbi:hypothetical protein HKBW3S44_01281 [Candidatus Hakubella thermalkaliphila]|uniref:Glycosyl transferase family 1 domain-containing protein n=2 Tax=Candidatus Hakubella thermalkaliphila TaxID=2754717 RepID=A0A6V8PYI3_9ACTN|nr:glycosyltransferase family 4 protein [Candidatus Hakubella thermalkaliphila]GFP37605.1 hypothetical protein HKBW3S44_01281 [Candidatus Hakubella thermalkaliphila]